MERPKRIFEDLQVAKLLFSYLLSLNSRFLAFMLHSFFTKPVKLESRLAVLKILMVFRVCYSYFVQTPRKLAGWQ